MLALFSLMGMKNIHTMNAFKSLLATLANGTAVVTFILARKVVWPEALLMTAGAAIGGYGGAFLAQRVDARRARAGAGRRDVLVQPRDGHHRIVDGNRRSFSHRRRMSGMSWCRRPTRSTPDAEHEPRHLLGVVAST